MSTTAAPANIDTRPRSTSRRVSISSVLDNPNLPSPPALVLQIVEKASQPHCDPDEVLALLKTDSGLCSQVLKTVNSGLFGLSKPVGTLKQAILLLGVRPLRSLVLSLALPAIRTPDRDDMIMKYWQESVAGAVIARELSLILDRGEAEDDLIAGLLRDLGILVFREAFADEYRALWKKSGSVWSVRQCELEHETFGVDHAEISAGILESWNLPAEIHQPIRYHHDPDAFPDGAPALQERAWLLSFASKVATLQGPSTAVVTELVQFAQKHFDMNQATLIKFLGSVTTAIQEFAGILKLDIGQCPNYSAIMAAGCQELVRLSVEPMRQSTKVEDVGGTTQAFGGMGSGRRQASAATIPEFDIDCLVDVPETGVSLNGYVVREILGQGAMGVVFKAHDPALDRFAAVKMMTPERLVHAEARDWFKREARAAAAIQHENVVTIYAVSEFNGLPYLVMEHLSGVSLQDRVDKEGPLPLASILRFGRQIAGGLGAAHARRVIHRDIKPANVLLGNDGNSVKITDFGLARILDDIHRSQHGMWVGTPQYMSPEQFNSTSVDHRADLFSLGSLLYTLCTGKAPFKAESIGALMKQICNNTPIPVRSIRPEIPDWLADVIGKLHAKSTTSRYQSADEVVAEFAKHGS